MIAVARPTRRFHSSDVLRMFPTFVWRAELRPDICRPLNASIEQGLAEIGAPLADLKHGESWQSDHGLHERHQFRGLVDCINEAIDTVLDYLKAACERAKITGCWANVSAPGADHRAHSHPNNYLSGVYYAQVPSGSGRIVFRDPRPQAMVLVPDARQRNPFNADQHGITPEPGDLILFHSWLTHMVEPNRSKEARISIAFNVTLRGIVGVELAGAVF